MELRVFGFKILNTFQGFVNKMTVIMKFSAMGPFDIPPWCNVYNTPVPYKACCVLAADVPNAVHGLLAGCATRWTCTARCSGSIRG
jgi:hypothetical protein